MSESDFAKRLMSGWLDLLRLLPAADFPDDTIEEIVHRHAEQASDHIRRLHRGGHRSLEELAIRGEGLLPSTIAELAVGAGMPLDPPPPQAQLPMSQLAPGHLLDYEWYFTPSTRETLATRVSSTAPTSVLLLGCPSLVAPLADRGLRVVLVDQSTHGLSLFGARRGHSVTLISSDIGVSGIDIAVRDAIAEPVPSMAMDKWGEDPQEDDPHSVETVLGRYDAVVLDPPWYPEYYVRWLEVALRCVRPGARIYFVAPSRFVRPTSQIEGLALHAALQQCGRVRELGRAIRYATPLFESDALQSLGFDPHIAWRSAELIELVVDEPSIANAFGSALDRWSTNHREPSRKWSEVQIAGQYVKFDAELTDRPTQPPVLLPLPSLADFVLPSVSRRVMERHGAAIWTSRNRVARTTDLVEMRRVLRQMDRMSQGEAEYFLTSRRPLDGSLETLLFR
ncbi:MAG: class I SAM-dependent methyltransferase [Acidimicrobiales bacterium]